MLGRWMKVETTGEDCVQRVRIDSEDIDRRASQLRQEARGVGQAIANLSELAIKLEVECQGRETADFSRWYFDTFQPQLVAGQNAINELAQFVDGCGRHVSGE